MKQLVEIPLLAKDIGREVSAYLNTLTKPIGSLGRLETLAVELAEMTGSRFPVVAPPGVLVFAADHGVTEEGVSAYPKEVTAQMVLNFLSGGAAMNVFSRQIGALFEIVDVGVAEAVDGEGLIARNVRAGTRNFCQEDAMAEEEVIQALNVGKEEAAKMIENGAKCLIVGEMGIGNTTSASALLSVITGKNVKELIGPGTGLNSDQMTKKQSVIERAIEARKPDQNDPLDLLKKLGGLEIAAMAGAMLEAARNRIPIIVDGFICTVAALIANQFDNRASDYMIAGHHSTEPGHKTALEELGKQPLLDLEMRLGEGTGAALAFPIVEAATNMLCEMATFSEAGVSGKSER
ncbi:nicotinate-nucleotide--dimethylbenzimidazole phosphoribosyltransferase [Pueribacillus theae]|uniref:Nicotinate-nucleotide--dimethylbenzimidazole phosphoribosyltransferase n=1 Tax=Pueribacillus theae TaxID=2171751 RepID=A0A2U1K3Y3_9BACI|nr:nicotinate-nucleotide--dimethylbenzimidazole phosphoribosyltransferase [Pueribacillus theae]PWA12226.1 nicotinate-nucleotide--dimethylbenzimidazole phosphoribosyltransferase [Pueribacillus theae]